MRVPGVVGVRLFTAVPSYSVLHCTEFNMDTV